MPGKVESQRFVDLGTALIGCEIDFRSYRAESGMVLML
jgi:hypothetical protein